MSLRQLSFADAYLGWSIFFTMLFGTIALFKAGNNLWSIVQYIAAATGVAVFVAAWFALSMWGVVQLAR